MIEITKQDIALRLKIRLNPLHKTMTLTCRMLLVAMLLMWVVNKSICKTRSNCLTCRSSTQSSRKGKMFPTKYLQATNLKSMVLQGGLEAMCNLPASLLQ